MLCAGRSCRHSTASWSRWLSCRIELHQHLRHHTLRPSLPERPPEVMGRGKLVPRLVDHHVGGDADLGHKAQSADPRSVVRRERRGWSLKARPQHLPLGFGAGTRQTPGRWAGLRVLVALLQLGRDPQHQVFTPQRLPKACRRYPTTVPTTPTNAARTNRVLPDSFRHNGAASSPTTSATSPQRPLRNSSCVIGRPFITLNFFARCGLRIFGTAADVAHLSIAQ